MNKLRLLVALFILSCPAWARFKLYNIQPVPNKSVVLLTWDDYASCYCPFEILRTTISGGYYEIIGFVSDAQRSFVDRSVDSETTYYYVIVETREDGSENDRSNEVFSTPGSRK